MINLNILWSELKTAQQRGFALYYIAFPQGTEPETQHYEVLGMEHDRFYFTRIEAGGDVTDFEENYKDTKAIPISSRDAVIALTPPPVNSLGATLVETTSRISQEDSLTIVSHDFSEPTTWWQNSTAVTSEELTDAGSGIFESAHPLWINIEHPKLFADEMLDVAAWVGAGYPGNLDPYYRSWLMPDSTMHFRNHFYPMVQIQPGGSGAWVTVMPDSGGSPNYDHTFDYAEGKVYFADVSGWAMGTKVRASYFYAVQTEDGSRFTIGPPAGKKWHLILTEVQISKGASWQDTLRFYGMRGGIAGRRARYKTYGNMQSTSTSSAGAVEMAGGQAESPQDWPPEADNGWTHGGCSGLRNQTQVLSIPPWSYKKPFVLKNSLGDKISIALAKGKKLLTAEQVNLTLYVDEFEE